MLKSTNETESSAPPIEVSSKAKRRTFTAKYKLRILVEADRVSGTPQMGALLRREGLYSSHITEWRRARDAGKLGGSAKSRGPEPRQRDPKDQRRIAELEREVERLKKRAIRAEAVIDLQKKVAELLGAPILDPSEML